MTNYEMMKSMSIEQMAYSIMCPLEMGFKEGLECEEINPKKAQCTTCCYDWLKEEME